MNVKYYTVNKTNANNPNYTIYTPFDKTGDLISYLESSRNLSHEIVVFLFKQILEGVQCMHEHKIYHIDLKLENVMYNDGDVKIIDFEAAQKAPDRICKYIGYITKAYALPFIVKTSKYTWNFNFNGFHQDLYSLGCMLIIMCCACSLHITPYKKVLQNILYTVDTSVSECINSLLEIYTHKNLMATYKSALESIQPTKKYNSVNELLSDIDAIDMTGLSMINSYKMPLPAYTRAPPVYVLPVGPASNAKNGGKYTRYRSKKRSHKRKTLTRKRRQ